MNRLRSSVRPLVTFALTSGVIYGFLVDKIPSDQFLLLATAAILFWFGSRKSST